MGDTDEGTSHLLGHTVVVIGGGAGTGLSVARAAKAAGARLIITDRDAGRLDEAADEIDVEATATFDPKDPVQVAAFLAGLPTPIDHVVLCRALDRLVVPLRVARFAAGDMRAGGSVTFVGATTVLPALIANLALETAPVRVNLITADRQLLGQDAVAALAINFMADPATTGMTFEIDRHS